MSTQTPNAIPTYEEVLKHTAVIYEYGEEAINQSSITDDKIVISFSRAHDPKMGASTPFVLKLIFTYYIHIQNRYQYRRIVIDIAGFGETCYRMQNDNEYYYQRFFTHLDEDDYIYCHIDYNYMSDTWFDGLSTKFINALLIVQQN